MRVLLDSDVILNLVLSRQPHFAEAHSIFRAIARKEFVAYVSAIAVLNVNYFAEKENDRSFALVEIEKLLSLVSVSSVDEKMLKSSLNSPVTDYEDAVQCASAMAENLDGIVTRNLKDFVNSPIPVYSPADFLEVFKKESTG
jgi:predicted nucleic acid-binding protein